MSISVENTIRGLTILTLKDKKLRSQSLQAKFREAEFKCAPGNKVLLDLGDINHLDAASIGVLMDWILLMQSRGRILRLCVKSRTMIALLELVRVHQVVEIYESSALALHGFAISPDQEMAFSAAS